MIDINNYNILNNNLSTLKETSKDNHNGEEVYMTESELPAVNFDDVKDVYISRLTVNEVPKSVDALFFDNKEDTITFIEFKNGYMKDKKVFDVRLKVFDSLLIFLDIVGKTIDYSRKHFDFILVYNKVKNVDNLCIGDEIQPSVSRTDISKILLEKRAKVKFIQFGLTRFEKLYFKEVYTYNEEEFETKFVADCAR